MSQNYEVFKKKNMEYLPERHDQHLKCLKDAGLIKGEVEGPRTCYCLDKVMLEKFALMVDSLGKSARP